MSLQSLIALSFGIGTTDYMESKFGSFDFDDFEGDYFYYDYREEGDME